MISAFWVVCKKKETQNEPFFFVETVSNDSFSEINMDTTNIELPCYANIAPIDLGDH